MQGVRDFGGAIIVALISIGLMLGALSIALVEFVPGATPAGTDNLLASPELLTATSTFLPTLTPIAGLSSSTPSITPTFANTVTPPISCLPPSGWVSQIIIQAGETLDSIATRYRISRDALRSANCLVSDALVSGARLYVPPIVPNTAAACSPGAAGWTNNYIVQPGDTLYRIGYNHYASLDLMRRVNCRFSDTIYPGERLWVPNLPTRTPYPTPLPGNTAIVYPTDPLTETALPFTATIIPSSTPVPATSTPVPTATPIPTHTPSPTSFPP